MFGRDMFVHFGDLHKRTAMLGEPEYMPRPRVREDL